MGSRTAFWQMTKEQLAAISDEFKMTADHPEFRDGRTFKIEYQSLFGETIRGMLLLPNDGDEFPLVVEFLGYLTKIEGPEMFAHWPKIGCACLVIDNRDQGGETFDKAPYDFSYSDLPLGRGFLKPEGSYMQRVIADNLRLLEVATEIAGVDGENIFLHGVSQGGGVSLLVNSLTDVPIKAVLANVPSHSNIERRINEGTGSYSVIHEYLQEFPEDRERVLTAMSFFDIKHFVSTISNPVFSSVGSSDNVCPMKDFFVSYHKIQALKKLTVYWQKGHEGGAEKQLQKEIELIKRMMKK